MKKKKKNRKHKFLGNERKRDMRDKTETVPNQFILNYTTILNWISTSYQTTPRIDLVGFNVDSYSVEEC